MKAIVLADGDAPDRAALDRAWPGWDEVAEVVVAADGGARHAGRLGLTILTWVGDGDSIDPDDLALLAERGVTIQRVPAAKDESDTELAVYCVDAVNQHCFGARITERLRDFMGHIDYRETHKNLGNLPAIEVPLVVMLATVNVFWTLANDVASEVNVQTAEGTSIDRSGQYNQIMSQIGALTARYQDLCGQLNVGLYRAETLQLRRTSHTTGRLVPVFAPREYDDHKWPLRLLPTIDRRDEDNSGVASPVWDGQGF